MVMAVDEAWQKNFLAGAEHRHVRIARLERVIGSRGNDDAIFLNERAVGDLFPCMTVNGARDHGAASDQRCGQSHAPMGLLIICSVTTSDRLGESLLLREGTVDLVAQQLGKAHAQLLAFR